MSLDQYIRSAREESTRRYIPSSLPTVNTLIQDISTNEKGLRSGRFYDIVGPKSTGKTLLAYDFIKNAQRLGIITAYADIERTFVPYWAALQGVDIDMLDMVHADTAEKNLEVIEYLSRHGYGLIVIDSLPALQPKILNDNDSDDADATIDYDKPKKIAALGSLVNDFVKRMIPIIDYWNTTLLFINQYRANFSTMSRSDKKPYEPWAYGYYLTGRLELANTANSEGVSEIQATITKHKLGIKQRVGKYNIIYGQGLDIGSDIIAHALLAGIVKEPKKSRFEWLNPETGELLKAHGAKQASQTFDIDRIKGQLNAME
jgi:RecA/RadA recombinase